MSVFLSPTVSREWIPNEQSGFASFSAASTKLVWRRASFDWRVPMINVLFVAESSEEVGGGADVMAIDARAIVPDDRQQKIVKG